MQSTEVFVCLYLGTMLYASQLEIWKVNCFLYICYIFNYFDSSKSLGPIHLKNEDQGVGCQITSLSNIKTYSYKFWPTWLGKHKLNNGDMKEHAKQDGEKLLSPQPYSQSQKPPRKTRRWEGPRRRPHQLVVQCQQLSMKTHIQVTLYKLNMLF